MACSMLFISLGAFEINPAVIELLLCWIALEPATVTFSMDLSFTLYPSLGSCKAANCWVSPRVPDGCYCVIDGSQFCA